MKLVESNENQNPSKCSTVPIPATKERDTKQKCVGTEQFGMEQTIFATNLVILSRDSNVRALEQFLLHSNGYNTSRTNDKQFLTCFHGKCFAEIVVWLPQRRKTSGIGSMVSHFGV